LGMTVPQRKMDDCNAVVGPVSAMCPAGSFSETSHVTGPTWIVLPRRQQKLAFTLENVFSESECDALRLGAEARGFTPAGIGAGSQQQVVTEIRSCFRLISEDSWLRDLIWHRVKEHIPVVWQGRYVIGPNEQLKFLRYTEGQAFCGHTDGCFRREGTPNQSFITLQIYLNKDAVGGATRFIGGIVNGTKIADVDCMPLAGRALVFQHDIFHEGALVESGIKYTIRTDIEYAGKSTRALLQAAAGFGGSPSQNRCRLRVTGFVVVALGAAAFLARRRT